MLVHILNLLIVATLVFLVATRGLERALPFLVFAMVLIPVDSLIRPADWFDLTTHRIAIVAIGVFFFAKKLSRRRFSGPRKDPLKYLMLLTIGWTTIATLFSVVPTVSLKATIAQAIEYFFLYFLLVETISATETIDRISLAMVVAVVVCSLFGVLELYQSWSVMDVFPRVEHRFGTVVGPLVDAQRGVRIRSTFPHPILFGGALAFAIPLALHLVVLARSRVRRILLWAGILLMFLNIYKTESRGPWLALALSLGFLFMFYRAMRKHLIFIAALTMFIFLSRPGVLETIKNRYQATFNPDSYIGASYQYRYALLSVSLNAVNRGLDRQLWGYGPRSFYDLGLEGEFQGTLYRFRSCDSSWIELMVETGFVGLLLIGALLLKAVFVSWQSFIRLPGPDRNVSLVFFTNGLAFCFLMSNVAIYGWGQNAYMFWIVAAMSVAYARLRAPATAEARQGLAPGMAVLEKLS